MPDSREPSVAVVGAAGYVGRELLHQLEEAGVRVSAIVRGPRELCVDGNFHAACSDPNEMRGQFDTVVNLAYPTSGRPYTHATQTDAIVRTVKSLLTAGGTLIHVSTLAVFGLALDRSIHPGPVSGARDNVYVESKIAAERLFVKWQARAGLNLHIVRLGNVWGRASGAWALPVVQRLITGRPVGVVGAPAYSNTTDVANAASYLASLIAMGGRTAGVSYHHVAEFSDVRWHEWVAPVADALGVAPVRAAASALATPTSGRAEIGGALSPLAPRSLYRALAAERISGSWLRSLIRRTPAPAREAAQRDRRGGGT